MPAGPGPEAGGGPVRFSHSGSRYLLGYGRDFFGIWDRTVPGGPVRRFDRSDEGWRAAWVEYARLEPQSDRVSGGPDGWGSMGAAREWWAAAPASAAFASPWARLAARLIDNLLLSAAIALVLVLAGVPLPDTVSALLTSPLLRVTVLLQAVYEITMTALLGQTVGKIALRVKVVKASDGTIPGWGPSFLRWAVPAGMNLIPPLGLVCYLWMLWDPRRQGLQDKAAGTLVMRVAYLDRALAP